MKRLVALLLAITMALCLLPASAEGMGNTPAADREPDISVDFSAQEELLYYTGGVVNRLLPRDDSSTLIQLAYTLTDTPYLLMGEEYVWDVFISGGTPPYDIDAVLAYQTLDMDPFQDAWYTYARIPVTDGSFTYTIERSGHYFWEIDICDSKNQILTFQTRIYETYTAADETNASTTVGKANSVVDALITDDMSDYTRALVLHDWLIHNANYDYTYTHYDAAGVLLYGTGVCDSYARAYLMLCTAAGLECMYVGGTAGDDPDPANWGNHGWNLVKLGGSWYHVDCTWDDPGTGGSERHDYFCVSDEVMAKDHRWNQPEDFFDNGSMLVPDAEGGEYEADDDESADYDFTFTTWEEYFEKFDAMVARGERREQTVGLYIGDLFCTDMYSMMGDYTGSKSQELANQGLITAAGRGYYGNYFYYNLTWNEPTSYIRIDETEAVLSVGETVTIIPASMVPVENTFTCASSNPDVATVSCAFDESAEAPFTVSIAAIAPGSSTITVTSASGASDSVTVTVLEPYQPDLALSLSTEDGLTLTWNSVPGVTQYKVMRICEGTTTTLLTTSACTASLTEEQLPANVSQTVYVLAERVVGGKTIVSYKSSTISYGAYSFTYAAVLPADALTIGDDAFLNNTSLLSVDVSDGVTSIGSRAFSGCSSLYVVRIPQSVISIGSGAFDGTALRYAEVTKGSFADTWLQNNYPDVYLIY